MAGGPGCWVAEELGIGRELSGASILCSPFPISLRETEPQKTRAQRGQSQQGSVTEDITHRWLRRGASITPFISSPRPPPPSLLGTPPHPRTYLPPYPRRSPPRRERRLKSSQTPYPALLPSYAATLPACPWPARPCGRAPVAQPSSASAYQRNASCASNSAPLRRHAIKNTASALPSRTGYRSPTNERSGGKAWKGGHWAQWLWEPHSGQRQRRSRRIVLPALGLGGACSSSDSHSARSSAPPLPSLLPTFPSAARRIPRSLQQPTSRLRS